MENEKKIKKVYFTLTGTKYHYGMDFLEKGMKLYLEKEPDNKYDKEAIMVKKEGLGLIGYVANSTYTVIGESMSAGRLYDKIGKKATAKVVMLTNAGVICKICKKVCWSISSKIKKSRKAKSRLNRIKRVSQRFHSICYTDFNNEKGRKVYA